MYAIGPAQMDEPGKKYLLRAGDSKVSPFATNPAMEAPTSTSYFSEAVYSKYSNVIAFCYAPDEDSPRYLHAIDIATDNLYVERRIECGRGDTPTNRFSIAADSVTGHVYYVARGKTVGEEVYRYDPFLALVEQQD